MLSLVGYPDEVAEAIAFVLNASTTTTTTHAAKLEGAPHAQRDTIWLDHDAVVVPVGCPAFGVVCDEDDAASQGVHRMTRRSNDLSGASLSIRVLGESTPSWRGNAAF